MKAGMRRIVLLAALTLFAVGWVFLMSLGAPRSGSANGADGSTASVTRINADEAFPEINTHVLIRDAAEEPIKGLTQEAFKLTEDGIPVDITSFVGAGGQVVTAILVIDHSGSMGGEKMKGAQDAAKVFVSMTREEKDNLGILVFGSTISTLVPLGPVRTGDKENLKRLIDGVSARGGTAFYDAVYSAVQQVATSSDRTVVIALTDGQDTDSSRSVDDVISLATANHIPIYTVGLSSGWRFFSLDYNGLERLAEETGGQYFETPSASELETWYRTLANELQNEYVLGYTSPTPELDGTQREVVVEINYDKGDMRVSAPYAVGGIIKSSINYPFFGGLLLLLLVLLTIPSVTRRIQAWRLARKAARPVTPAVPPTANPMGNRTSWQRQPPMQPPAVQTIPPGSPPAFTPANTFTPADTFTPAPAFTPTPAFTPLSHSDVAQARLIMRSVLSRESITVGSGAGNHLIIPAPSVAAQHARIALENGHYVVTDLSQGRTNVSFSGQMAQARPITKNALKDGSLIQVGNVSLYFRKPVQGLPWLDLTYQIATNGASIGYDASNDITLSHPSLSPRHAQLRQESNRWTVQDLNSAQGTFVSYNGNPTQERKVISNALKDGSTVRFGELVFVFRTE